MRVDVVPEAGADRVAARLSGLDEAGLLALAVVDEPGPAALVISTVPDPRADAVAEDEASVDELWRERIEPMARLLAGLAEPRAPKAVLHEHDPALASAARRLLDRMRAELLRSGIADESWTFDHIGSTAVPGLRAKRFVDLQIGVAPLPEEGSVFDEVLAAIGCQPAKGSRSDSPGVYRDSIKDPALAPPQMYHKRLYVRPDPAAPSIVHVRLLGSPWWSCTVRFRDWLRADASARDAYEAMKVRLAREHADDPDYDDYTRAKAAFFTEHEHRFRLPREHHPLG